MRRAGGGRRLEEMLHEDAKAIRERLNAVMLAVSTLEQCTQHPAHGEIARAAQEALQEISALVTDDEKVEHGEQPSNRDRAERERILAENEASVG